MLLHKQAALEVQLHESRIELLRSMHKECEPSWDWEEIKSSQPPVAPAQKHDREKNASDVCN